MKNIMKIDAVSKSGPVAIGLLRTALRPPHIAVLNPTNHRYLSIQHNNTGRNLITTGESRLVAPVAVDGDVTVAFTSLQPAVAYAANYSVPAQHLPTLSGHTPLST